jgi:hypothetical protein
MGKASKECEAMQEQMMLLTAGELGDVARQALELHVRTCTDCSTEWAQAQALLLLIAARPAAEPSANLLASARMSLDEALDRVPPVRSFGRLRQVLQAWAFQAQAAPALAVLLLAVGFAGGGVAGVQAARHSAAKASAQAAGIATVAPNALPEGIANVSAVTVQPGSNLVQVHYNRLVPGTLEGQTTDPRIQQMLVLATQNRANPGVRVDSVGLLAEQCHVSQDCGSQSDGAQVRKALMASLRYDKNAGVRLKALDGLANYVGTDPAVRDSVLEALLHDDNPGIRTQAIQMLTPVQADGSVRQVLHALAQDDRNPYIRTVSQETLAQGPDMQ